MFWGQVYMTQRLNSLGLDVDSFGLIFSFFEPKDLRRSEGVSKGWHQFIVAEQWEIHFRIRLGLPPGIRSEDYLPKGLSYKKAVQLVFPSLLDRRV